MENPSQSLLLVDDEPSVLETFKQWLEGEGYSVYTAASQKEAVKILEDSTVAVCLIDLKMGEENGLEIAKELKKADALIKVIIFTGYPSYESAIDAIKSGIFDYVSKTSEGEEILQKIENAVETRQREIAEKTAGPGDRKNIILVCHHEMIKEGFDKFCREEPGYHLMHTYHSIDYIKTSDFNHKASLVLLCMACNQNHLGHLEKTFSTLNLYFPNASLVVINSQFSDEEQVELIKLGIKGFLPKNILRENMKKAFENVLEGQFWVSRDVTQRLLNELLEKTSRMKYKKPENVYHLSGREIEILQAMASGLSNFAISNKLFISEKTVKAHIYHIFKKMGVKSRTQAIVKATEAHII